MAAAGKDGPRSVVFWRTALPVCSSRMSRCLFIICGLFDLPQLVAPVPSKMTVAANRTPPPDSISHARCWRAIGRCRRFPGRLELLTFLLFLVSAGFYTAPLINTFGRLHWAGDNPGANLIGLIAGSTFFVIVVCMCLAVIAPIPFLLKTISRSASERCDPMPDVLRSSSWG